LSSSSDCACDGLDGGRGRSREVRTLSVRKLPALVAGGDIEERTGEDKLGSRGDHPGKGESEVVGWVEVLGGRRGVRRDEVNQETGSEVQRSCESVKATSEARNSLFQRSLTASVHVVARSRRETTSDFMYHL
jgi:hypothetical protein